MKRILHLIILACCLSACVDEDDFKDTPMDNFEALWQLIDEHYCFLDYKQIDWNAIHAKYAPQVKATQTEENLFEVLGNMLAELKDGHVNLYTTHNMARYWDWFESYPRNFSEELVERYLGQGYRISGGLEYTILSDNIGYVYFGSFSSAAGNGSLSEMLDYFSLCDGLIIDVRQNGGGNLTTADRIAARFTNEKTLVGYICHKTGKGHSDFSAPEPIYLEPSDRIRWQKPVVVLTNRHSYSATNYFANIMSQLPLVTLMGDQTGGGSGMPFTSELPNGWGVRFSACPILNAEKQHTEFGIEPDIHVDMEEDDQRQGIDTMIEAARTFLKSK